MNGRPKVLFIHGLFSGRSVWGRVISELRGEVDCVSLNLPGYGRTHLHDGAYDADGLADWLMKVVEREKPTHIVGHSMGGILALVLAARAPKGVERIGIIGLPIYSSALDGRTFLAQRGRALRTVLRWHRATHSCCIIARRTYRWWGGIVQRRYPYQPPVLIRSVVNHCSAAHGHALENIIWGGLVDELGAKNQLPVAALHGSGDRAAPVQPVVEASERWGWDLSVVHDANHQVLVERPRLTANWIREHVLKSAESERRMYSEGLQAAGG